MSSTTWIVLGAVGGTAVGIGALITLCCVCVCVNVGLCFLCAAAKEKAWKKPWSKKEGFGNNQVTPLNPDLENPPGKIGEIPRSLPGELSSANTVDKNIDWAWENVQGYREFFEVRPSKDYNALDRPSMYDLALAMTKEDCMKELEEMAESKIFLRKSKIYSMYVSTLFTGASQEHISGLEPNDLVNVFNAIGVGLACASICQVESGPNNLALAAGVGGGESVPHRLLHYVQVPSGIDDMHTDPVGLLRRVVLKFPAEIGGFKDDDVPDAADFEFSSANITGYLAAVAVMNLLTRFESNSSEALPDGIARSDSGHALGPLLKCSFSAEPILLEFIADMVRASVEEHSAGIPEYDDNSQLIPSKSPTVRSLRSVIQLSVTSPELALAAANAATILAAANCPMLEVQWKGVNLSGAVLDQAIVDGDMQDADLSGVSLKGAVLSANLVGTTLESKYIPSVHSPKWIKAIAASPNTPLIAVVYEDDDTVRVLNVEKGLVQIASFPVEMGSLTLRNMRLSNSGNRLVMIFSEPGSDRIVRIRLFDLLQNTCKNVLANVDMHLPAAVNCEGTKVFASGREVPEDEDCKVVNVYFLEDESDGANAITPLCSLHHAEKIHAIAVGGEFDCAVVGLGSQISVWNGLSGEKYVDHAPEVSNNENPEYYPFNKVAICSEGMRIWAMGGTSEVIMEVDLDTDTWHNMDRKDNSGEMRWPGLANTGDEWTSISVSGTRLACTGVENGGFYVAHDSPTDFSKERFDALGGGSREIFLTKYGAVTTNAEGENTFATIYVEAKSKSKYIPFYRLGGATAQMVGSQFDAE